MMALVTRSTPCAKIFFFLLSTSFLSGTWVKADSFLGHKGGFGRLSGYIPSRFLNTFNVEQELESALREALGLGHGLTEEAAETKTGQVNTMFQTMPKNMYGRVGRDAMQYMVSRYFGEHYGWSIKGFDPASKAGNASQEAAPVTILQEKLPEYVETVVAERLERHGFALNDTGTYDLRRGSGVARGRLLPQGEGDSGAHEPLGARGCGLDLHDDLRLPGGASKPDRLSVHGREDRA
jgi:hypothetical protein